LGDRRRVATREAGSNISCHRSAFISSSHHSERLAAGLEGVLLRTEIYSIHGFSHVFFGIGLASIILFFRPRSSARVVILGVLLAGIAWELHEGLWLSGEPLDSVEDVMLGILSASTFLCLIRRNDREDPARFPKEP
jgi:hypothetical protein